MKKILLTASIMSLSVLSQATYAQTPSVYVGAFGAYTTSDDDLQFDIDGGDLGLFGGVRVDNDTSLFYADLEAHFALSYAEGSSSSVTMEKEYEIGISFRPGLAFGEERAMRAYGILGYKNTNFEVSGSGAAYDGDLDGFEVGAGAQYAFTPNWAMRGEYTYTDYDPSGTYDPSENLFRLGLQYQFNAAEPTKRKHRR